MNNQKLEYQLQKLKTQIEAEKIELEMYRQNLEECQEHYSISLEKFKAKQRELELRIDKYYYELRKSIKGGDINDGK